jgi:inward rectifier potassium channel
MSYDSPEPSRPSRTAMIRPENVRRLGVKKQLFTDLYHHLLTISWPWFLAVVLGSYLTVNVLFAALYLLARDAIEGGSGNRVLDAKRSGPMATVDGLLGAPSQFSGRFSRLR